MAKSIKVRAKAKGDEVTVKALFSHPMETGLRKDKKSGKIIPAHFIQEVLPGASKTTAMRSAGCSRLSLAIMLRTPCSAPVGSPLELVSLGSAWNARYR